MDCETYNIEYGRTIDMNEEQVRVRWQEMNTADCKLNERLVFKSNGKTVSVNLYSRMMLLCNAFIGDSLTAKISTLE